MFPNNFKNQVSSVFCLFCFGLNPEWKQVLIAPLDTFTPWKFSCWSHCLLHWAPVWRGVTPSQDRSTQLTFSLLIRWSLLFPGSSLLPWPFLFRLLWPLLYSFFKSFWFPAPPLCTHTFLDDWLHVTACTRRLRLYFCSWSLPWVTNLYLDLPNGHLYLDIQ